MDPLSDVLALLKPTSYLAGGFDIGGQWSIRFPEHAGIKCYSVGAGQCWLAVEDGSEPVYLSAGDCFLLTRGRPFRLTSDLALPPVDFKEYLKVRSNRNFGVINGGGGLLIVGGHFALSERHAAMLLKVLPPVVHIQKESDRAALRWSVERMMFELSDPQPGSLLVAQQLAQMMLVQALRLTLAEGKKGGVGWLFALADAQISRAIDAIHDHPARRWTLSVLGHCAGMSRSSFAQKFKDAVGVTPMDYVTQWRMLLASDRLQNSSAPISAIALSLGYESESAFSTAFKREMGRSPRQYARQERDDLNEPGHPGTDDKVSADALS
jgi:AraC-like DNA-binding protein